MSMEAKENKKEKTDWAYLIILIFVSFVPGIALLALAIRSMLNG